MAYFLGREEPSRANGKRVPNITVGQSPYAEEHRGPGSPLSRLVQDGYSAAPGRPPVCPTGGGFDAGVAQQWNSNVRDNNAMHQQQHDPNYAVLKPKTNGFRVSQAAGGQSSLSLAHEEQPVPYRSSSRGPPGGGRAASPGFYGGGRAASPGGLRGASPGRMEVGRRDPSPGVGQRAAYDASAGRPPQAGHYGGGCGHGASPDPTRPPVGRGGLSQQEAYAMEANRQRGSGDRGGARGGDSYSGGAGNGGQNTGNKIGDRNSSRVLAPPGGFSSFSLG